MPDLLELARNAGELNLRALALEAYVRLACDNERLSVPPQKRVELLKPALAGATRPEDKRLILAELAVISHPMRWRWPNRPVLTRASRPRRRSRVCKLQKR